MESTKEPTPGSAGVLSQRLDALDAYRGFTMLAMVSGGLGLSRLAREFPESAFWRTIGDHVRHAPWVGCTAWDLIQPSFMFMVGVSMAYSCASRRARGQSGAVRLAHAIYRAVFLILLGVLLRSNGSSETYWTFEDVVSQIGLGYVFLFLLWGRGARLQLAVAGGVLVAYWGLFALWPLPGPEYDYQSAGVDPAWEHNLSGFLAHWNKNANPAHAFDVWFLNLFPRSSPFLNNGGGYHTLSFLPSFSTMAFGLVAGEFLERGGAASRKISRLVACGFVGLVLGWLLHALGICPIVKRIWTPAWTVFSTGWCLLLLGGFFFVIDVQGYRRWAFPGIVVGRNSITMYVLSGLVAGWIVSTIAKHFGDVFGLLGEPYRPLLEKLAVVCLLFAIGLWMYRRRLFLRV